jgi:hypothetical protein
MIGSWRWNAASGGFGALLTLLFSLGNNPLLTTLIRGLIAFVVFALMALAVRFFLGVLLLPASRPDPDELAEEDRGNVLDLVTPEDGDSLSEMMKENWSDGKDSPVSGFQPLEPIKLVKLDEPDPEEVVKAIRRLTDE